MSSEHNQIYEEPSPKGLFTFYREQEEQDSKTEIQKKTLVQADCITIINQKKMKKKAKRPNVQTKQKGFNCKSNNNIVKSKTKKTSSVSSHKTILRYNNISEVMNYDKHKNMLKNVQKNNQMSENSCLSKKRCINQTKKVQTRTKLPQIKKIVSSIKCINPEIFTKINVTDQQPYETLNSEESHMKCLNTEPDSQEPSTARYFITKDNTIRKNKTSNRNITSRCVKDSQMGSDSNCIRQQISADIESSRQVFINREDTVNDRTESTDQCFSNSIIQHKQQTQSVSEKFLSAVRIRKNDGQHNCFNSTKSFAAYPQELSANQKNRKQWLNSKSNKNILLQKPKKQLNSSYSLHSISNRNLILSNHIGSQIQDQNSGQKKTVKDKQKNKNSKLLFNQEHQKLTKQSQIQKINKLCVFQDDTNSHDQSGLKGSVFDNEKRNKAISTKLLPFIPVANPVNNSNKKLVIYPINLGVSLNSHTADSQAKKSNQDNQVFYNYIQRQNSPNNQNSQKNINEAKKSNYQQHVTSRLKLQHSDFLKSRVSRNQIISHLDMSKQNLKLPIFKSPNSSQNSMIINNNNVKNSISAHSNKKIVANTSNSLAKMNHNVVSSYSNNSSDYHKLERRRKSNSSIKDDIQIKQKQSISLSDIKSAKLTQKLRCYILKESYPINNIKEKDRLENLVSGPIEAHLFQNIRLKKIIQNKGISSLRKVVLPQKQQTYEHQQKVKKSFSSKILSSYHKKKYNEIEVGKERGEKGREVAVISKLDLKDIHYSVNITEIKCPSELREWQLKKKQAAQKFGMKF